MKNNHTLRFAVLAALGAQAGLAYSATATDTEATVSGGIEEIVVTAQRREESVQNVPITMQALSGDTLKQLSVTTFDEVLRYVPNVTFGTNGPGMGSIFMRGLSAGFAGGQSSATFSPFPNVATYLDDQSLQFPARNLDVYMVDMERIEVLEGPQGTLFGGGAEAGAIRYITNKPKLDKVEGNVEASYGTTAGGDPNKSLNATINLPLIDGKLAVRATIYDDRRGGYITNVPSTFTRKNSDLGNHYWGIVPDANGQCPNGQPAAVLQGSNPPALNNCAVPGSPVANNYNIAGSASNPVEYGGIRVSALYQINDDWNALISQTYQDMEADGLFTQFPTGSDGQALGAWQVTQFSPAVNKDHFTNTSWTVNGKIGDLRAVYSGGYLVRHIDQTNDYSNYSRSGNGQYYTCAGGPMGNSQFGPGTTPVCYSPVTSWHDQVENTHQTHEVRLSTPDDWRTRAILGGFWEDFEVLDDMQFLYKTIPSCTAENLAVALAGGPACVANVGPNANSTTWHPGIRNDSVAYGQDVGRGYKQGALFTSIDFDIIPKVLTLTGGTRYYHYSEFERGSKFTTTPACTNVPNGTCTGGNIHPIDGYSAAYPDSEHENATYSGFKSRANLTWHVTPDAMLYYTFSQGFRPGGFNRTVAVKANLNASAPKDPQYASPLSYAPDSLTNNEFGWKTEFLNHRLQLNGSVYKMDWNNVQFTLYNPPALGNTTFVVNGPNYTIKGLELQLVAKLTDGLTVQGSSSWNSANQSSQPCLVSNVASSPTLGQCITQVKGQKFQNPFGAQDTRPAFSPPLEFNLRARYDWSYDSYQAFIMLGGNHIAHMSNQPASYVDGATQPIPTTTWLRYDQPGYTTYDASLGVAKDNWTAQLYGTNLTNSDASTFTSSAQFIKSEVPLRPRVLGLKIGMKF